VHRRFFKDSQNRRLPDRRLRSRPRPTRAERPPTPNPSAGGRPVTVEAFVVRPAPPVHTQPASVSSRALFRPDRCDHPRGVVGAGAQAVADQGTQGVGRDQREAGLAQQRSHPAAMVSSRRQPRARGPGSPGCGLAWARVAGDARGHLLVQLQGALADLGWASSSWMMILRTGEGSPSTADRCRHNVTTAWRRPSSGSAAGAGAGQQTVQQAGLVSPGSRPAIVPSSS